MTAPSQAKTMATNNNPQGEAAERQPSGKEALVKEYRKVGPAAINAALLCSSKKKKKEPKRSYEPHEEI